MTEEQLTALAKQTLDWPGRGRPHYAIQLAAGYLALLAEREALKADVEALKAQLAGRSQVMAPNYGCTCHSSAGCHLHTWTNPVSRS
jgi:hypothetical protein